MPFAIGQRWLSESENALGLGIITALDQRTVTIYFPAADETRIYAAAQAPLLRYRTLCHQQAQFKSPLRGLHGTRAGLIPHQLHIATEVGNRVNPRVLLADEVGLGKTIEAGMILQNQLFAEKVQRVLIIVPET